MFESLSGLSSSLSLLLPLDESTLSALGSELCFGLLTLSSTRIATLSLILPVILQVGRFLLVLLPRKP